MDPTLIFMDITLNLIFVIAFILFIVMIWFFTK